MSAPALAARFPEGTAVETQAGCVVGHPRYHKGSFLTVQTAAGWTRTGVSRLKSISSLQRNTIELHFGTFLGQCSVAAVASVLIIIFWPFLLVKSR
jgi:hypothetical protein